MCTLKCFQYAEVFLISFFFVWFIPRYLDDLQREKKKRFQWHEASELCTIQNTVNTLEPIVFDEWIICITFLLLNELVHTCVQWTIQRNTTSWILWSKFIFVCLVTNRINLNVWFDWWYSLFLSPTSFIYNEKNCLNFEGLLNIV